MSTPRGKQRNGSDVYVVSERIEDAEVAKVRVRLYTPAQRSCLGAGLMKRIPTEKGSTFLSMIPKQEITGEV